MTRIVSTAVGGLLLLLTAVHPAVVLAQPLAQGQPKFLGCALDAMHANFATYWNQVTPGNSGKWGSVEGTMDFYNWTPLEAVYQFARTNAFKYKHHNLVWGSQQPAWITTLDSAAQRAQIEEWFQLVGDRYGAMDFCDVVNEPIRQPAPYTHALGDSGATGFDWVITAFRLARTSCFGVKLVLNEYGILHDNALTTRYLAMIDTLRGRRLLDGIGIQGHYFEFKSAAGMTPSYTWPISTIKANLDRLAGAGLPIYITEFDIDEADDNTQLTNYQTYFPIFWEHPAVKGITLWGYVQGDTWKTNAYLLLGNGTERPAMKWLKKYVATPLPTTVLTPSGSTGEPRNPLLRWRSSAKAMAYRVQIALTPGFSSPVIDTTVADTTTRVGLLNANSTYYWRVSAKNDSGYATYSNGVSFATGDQVLAVETPTEPPLAYVLGQNYPNPFNPTTTITFTIPTRTQVRIELFNMLGQGVQDLASGTFDAGKHEVHVDASRFASGVYVYRMVAQNTEGSSPFTMSRKLMLMK